MQRIGYEMLCYELAYPRSWTDDRRPPQLVLHSAGLKALDGLKAWSALRGKGLKALDGLKEGGALRGKGLEAAPRCVPRGKDLALRESPRTAHMVT